MAVAQDGSYRFRTIRPVPYAGRTSQVHFKVRLGQRELLTTQLYVAGDVGNARDPVWRGLSEAERSAVTVPFAPGADGAVSHRGRCLNRFRHLPAAAAIPGCPPTHPPNENLA